MNYFLTILLLSLSVNSMAQLHALGSGVYHWNQLNVTKDNNRESRKLAEGTTPEFEYFEMHATTQFKGALPRPPHTQSNIEELIIIKEGSMKCAIGKKTAVLGKGSVLLIPP